MRSRILNLAIAIALGLGLYAAPASAACSNASTVPPAYGTYIQPNADGTVLFQVWEWDNDNLNAKGLAMYRINGKIVNESTINTGFASILLKPGEHAYTTGKNVGGCGNFINWQNGPRY